MAIEYIYDINLDINASNSYIVIEAKQGDSARKVVAAIYRNGQPYVLDNTFRVTYRVRKPDGTSIWNPASIENGKVSFYFTKQSLAAPGRAFADITIQDANGLVSTASFIIIIQSMPNISDGIKSSNEFIQIQEVLGDALNVINESESWAVGTKGGEQVLGPSTIRIDKSSIVSFTPTVNASIFRNKVGIHPGKEMKYRFIYRADDQKWIHEEKEVNLSDYGISLNQPTLILNDGDYVEVTVVDADLTYLNNAKYWAEYAEEHSSAILGLTATGSVDNAVGVPSISVNVTTVDTHKNIDFAFHNMKGNGIRTLQFSENGIVTVTLDNNTVVTFDGVKEAIDLVNNLVDSIENEWENELKPAVQNATVSANQAAADAEAALRKIDQVRSYAEAAEASSIVATNQAGIATTKANLASEYAQSAGSSKDAAIESKNSALNSATAAEASKITAVNSANAAAASAASAHQDAETSRQRMEEVIAAASGVIVVDNTLTLQGAAADAKVAGDRITSLQSEKADKKIEDARYKKQDIETSFLIDAVKDNQLVDTIINNDEAYSKVVPAYTSAKAKFADVKKIGGKSQVTKNKANLYAFTKNNGYITIDGNEFTFTQSGNFDTAYLSLNGLKASTSYTVSFNIKSYREGYPALYLFSANASSGYRTCSDGINTFITTSGSDGKLYFYFRPSGASGITATAVFENLQIEEGSSATKFEPYFDGIISADCDAVKSSPYPFWSYVKNQMVNVVYSTQTVNGITFTRNSNGSWTLDGTATALAYINVKTIAVKQGHKYLLGGGISSDVYIDLSSSSLWGGSNPKDEGNGGIGSAVDSATSNVEVIVKSGVTVSNVTVFPSLIDLTQWFNGDSTILASITTSAYAYAFGVPRTYIPYDTGTIVDASTAQLNISAGLRTAHPLRSAGTAHDEYNVARKYTVVNVGDVDLGTLDYTYHSSGNFYSDASALSGRAQSSALPYCQAICGKYTLNTTEGIGSVTALTQDKYFAFQPSVPNRLIIRDSVYTDAIAFKTAMDGVHLYYELETPIYYYDPVSPELAVNGGTVVPDATHIVDAESYFPDGTYLPVKDGGSITFHQASTEFPIPNEEDFYYTTSFRITDSQIDALFE